MVRDSPALASWFAVTRPAHSARELAGQSEVITALAAAFVNLPWPRRPCRRGAPGSLGGAGAHLAADVPVGFRDDDEERAMIEEFVVPIIAPVNARR